ncbi:MAG TPA: translation initiation factor IF-2 [Phycisphaerae bacterium]|nr:translation initiation factor IF-2 [Phycisphaerae bacterium]
MAEKLRVHILSKELVVTSKAIIEKCALEGVEGITNHMSTVSAGLAETIREWFSAQSGGTAVEEAPPVDLQKARAKRRDRRPKKEKAADKPEAEAAEPAPVTEPAEAPPEESAEAQPTATPSEAPPAVAAEAESAPVAEAPAPVVEAEQSPTVAAAAQVVETVIIEKPKEKEKEGSRKKEADRIAPAGPQNVPAPAQMKGPRIVGYAKPDVIERPVPRTQRPMPVAGQGSDHPDVVSRSRKGGKGKGKAEEDAKVLRARMNPRRSRSSLAEVGERLREWNERDLLERQERLHEATGRGIHARRAREKAAAAAPGHVAPRKTKAQVSEPIIVNELSLVTGIGLNQLFPKFQREHNMLVNRNSVIPTELAQAVLADFGIELEAIKPKTRLELLKEGCEARERANLQPRPPVVTMLGHVDHGKTSLLDAIRKTSVAAGEAGGITQHMGAYRVKRGNLSVTFLDTPGHEAFTAMRARGADMTDVVVLVVAANDGVMPQTVEAANHAKAARKPIVVALNKIDLPGVDLNKVYGQLAELELAPAEWGGETDVIKTSATTGQGVQELVTHLTTLTELLDLKADPMLPAQGAVIEAQMQSAVGPIARVLIREGTLKRGDFLVCGPAAGRVRLIRDDKGKPMTSAGPSMPVEVGGLDAVPNAGDLFYCVSSLQEAKDIAGEAANLRRQEQLQQIRKPRTLDDLFAQRTSGKVPELNLIMRADVQGSVDALLKVLNDIPDEQVKLNFLHTGIGGVTESDVVLASASNAMIVGFNVTVDTGPQKLADRDGVDVRLYRIIYEVADDIRKALEGLLPRERKEEFRGRAEVREVFRVSRVGVVAGCFVTEGTIARSNVLKVIRDGTIIIPTQEDVRRERHRGIASLKRFKDDAREVRTSMECGIRVEDFDDVKPGDIIEAYEVVETARTLG